MSDRDNLWYGSQGVYGSPVPSGLTDLRLTTDPRINSERSVLADRGIVPWEPGAINDDVITPDWPTRIFMNNYGIIEHSPNGTKIGDVLTNDYNGPKPPTLTLIDDAGGRFVLIGDNLLVANGTLLDHATSASHDIIIEALNPLTGKGVRKIITITVEATCNDFEAADSLDWFNRKSLDAVPELVADPANPSNQVMLLYPIEPYESRDRASEAVIKTNIGHHATPSSIEFKVRFGTILSQISGMFWAGDYTLPPPDAGASGRNAITYLGLRNDTFKWYSDLQGWNNISGVVPAANTWYSFELKNFNPGAFTYEIWIDSVLRATADYRNHNSTHINWFSAFQNSLHKSWWDDMCFHP